MKAFKETIRKYYKYQYSVWTRPNLTANGTLGGSSFASAGANGDSYKAFDGNTSTYSQIFTNAETTKTLYFYNPNPLKITSLTFTYYSGTQIQEATIYGSNDNTNWDIIISYTNNSNPNTVTFPNDTLPYTYYKLYVTKAAGSAGYAGYILSDINEITFNAQERTVVESTSSDYDFYKDVDVYSNPKEIVRKYYKYQEQNWTQPYMTEDVSVGGDRFGAEASAINGANGPYKAFDGNSNNAGTCWQTPFSNTNPQWITFYNPVPLKVSSLVIYNYYNTSDSYAFFYIKKAIIQGSNDNTNWTNLKTITGSSWTRTITADLSDNTNFYNYYRIYIEERGYYSAYYSEAIILEVEITAKYRTIIPGTSSDYDFYEDVDEYKAFKI